MNGTWAYLCLMSFVYCQTLRVFLIFLFSCLFLLLHILWRSYIRKFHDEIIGIGLACGPLYLLLRHILTAVSNVLSNGGGKKNRLLTHNANHLPQTAHIQSANVMAIYTHLEKESELRWGRVEKVLPLLFWHCLFFSAHTYCSFLGVVKALNQLDCCTFTTTAATYKSNSLSTTNLQIHAI